MAASGTTKKLLADNIRANMADGAANSVQRTVKAKFAEVISVKDFGAVGDDSTDTALRLPPLRNYMNADRLSIIHFLPSRVYIVT